MNVDVLAQGNESAFERLRALNPEAGMTGNPGPPPRTHSQRTVLPRLALVAAITLAVVIGGVAVWNSSTGQDTITAATDPVQATPEASSPEPSNAPVITDTARAQTPVSNDPVEDIEPPEDATRYLPTSDWELIGFGSDIFSPTDDLPPGHELMFATSDGIWGPVIFAVFNPGLEDINYGPSGSRITETPAGTRVRARIDASGRTTSAIVAVEGGSVAASGSDVSESQLFEVVDNLEIIDGSLTWTGNVLPANLMVLPQSAAAPQTIEQSTFQPNDENVLQSVHVLSVPVDDPWIALNERDTHPDWELTTFNGQPAIVFGPSTYDTTRAGVIYQADERLYIATIDGEDSQIPTIDDARTLLASVEPRSVLEIADELDLVRRVDIYTEWLEDIELPVDADIDYLLTDDYVPIGPEALFAQQVLVCLWVEEWIETGSQRSFDAIEQANTWPNIIDAVEWYRQFGDDLAEFVQSPVVEIEGLTGSTVEERAVPSLQASCGFAIGHDLFSHLPQ